MRQVNASGAALGSFFSAQQGRPVQDDDRVVVVRVRGRADDQESLSVRGDVVRPPRRVDPGTAPEEEGKEGLGILDARAAPGGFEGRRRQDSVLAGVEELAAVPAPHDALAPADGDLNPRTTLDRRDVDLALP